MANILKTEYMNRPTIGFSEYITKTSADLPSNPNLGDRAIVTQEGKLYCCIDGNDWEEIYVQGGVEPTGITVLTTNGTFDVTQFSGAQVNVQDVEVDEDDIIIGGEN